MKLIDLLVQHLGSDGGWPIGAEICAQDSDGEVCFYANSHIRRRGNNLAWSIPELGENKVVKRRIFMKQAEDMAESIITREQYEAALAASNQVEWDGEGLPPVGCECELVNFFGNDFPEFVGEPDEVVKIIGNGFTNSCPVAFYEADGGRGGMLAYAVAQCFRPIRNETERKREETIKQMMDCSAVMVEATAGLIYDAIAAGKIPGVKLED